MNPCADDFTPLSTPDMECSSSVTTLDEDVCSSGSAGIRFMLRESDKTYLTSEPISYNLEQSLSPLQVPFSEYLTPPYPSIPLGFHFGSHQGWSVHPWYNPAIVSGHDCGTPPQPLHGSSSLSPMGTVVAPMNTLQAPAVPSPGVVTERSSASEAVHGRQLGRQRVPKDFFTQDELRGDIKTKDYKALVSGLKPLACTSSSARQCAIDNHSNGLRETARRTRGKSAHIIGSTSELSHNGRRQYFGLNPDMLSSLPNSATSTSSFPLWPDNTLPLSARGSLSPNVPSLDILKSSDTLRSDGISLSGKPQHPQHLSHMRSMRRNFSSRASLEQWEMLPAEVQQLPELGISKSLVRSSKAPASLGQESGILSMADTATAEDLQGTAEIKSSCPNSPVIVSNMHFLTADKPAALGREIRGHRNSEPCPSANFRTQQHTQQRAPGQDLSRKRSKSNSDKDSTSGTFKPTSNKGAFSTLQVPANASSVRNVTESGSWSQSKRWMSQTSKERMIFQRMVTNLFHLGANNSPFVPQSPAELTAFRAEMADIKKKRLSREVGWRVATIERKRTRSKGSGEEAIKLVPFFQGKQFKDKLSPVFASSNCFKEHISRDDTQWVVWPSLPEFKDEGDKRSLQHGRRFPLPRLGISTQAIANVLEHGHKTPWQMKTVKIDTRFIHPVTELADECNLAHEPPLTEQEIPHYLRIAIQTMEKELDD
ncbi:hypothetical protein C2857_007055 [Epichloe festucae Fl1]|uniref:Uncharacterized protein n=1 Tax=Epichloe festucae (strain Fl1) TaxID=877507 RepID=A0A7S9KQE7_EPIFF|nr:hypothetical protein C2857_007055 [Epichloe festucae Fl1]